MKFSGRYIGNLKTNVRVGEDFPFKSANGTCNIFCEFGKRTIDRVSL